MFSGMTVDVHGRTDIGRSRRANEDQFLIAELHKVAEIKATSLPRQHVDRIDGGVRGLLLMVADGLGGHAGGREASALALEVVADYVAKSMRSFYRFDSAMEGDLMRELTQSVFRCHQAIVSRAEKEPWLSHMSTTLTKLHVLWPNAYLVQVGDSRCYRMRGERLERLSTDQSVAQKLVDWGDLTPEEAEKSRWAHVLTETVGGRSKQPHPTISKVELIRGDTLLLCSDGLTRHLGDKKIAEVLSAQRSARDACDALVAEALEAGGEDNVTVVVSRFHDAAEGTCAP